jgi:hypothetical protein
MTTKSKKTRFKMQISQGDVAKSAIHNIELLFKKLGLEPKIEKNAKRVLLGSAHVPTQLVAEVAAAADQHGALIGIPFDAEAARQALAFADAFEPVATKAEAFAQRVRDAVLTAKYDVGSASLAAYAAMKGIVRRPEGAGLRDSFDRMTTIMKRGRRAQPSLAPVIALPTPAEKQPAPTVVVQLPQDKAA